MPHISITAATTPHKAAIIMASTGAITTYEELDRHSNQVAQALRTLGVHAGDHIALMMENSAHVLEICWGA